MAYTTIDDPSAYFQTTLYTGNGSTNAITNSGNSDLQPDWVWIKKRSATENHALYDSVRGTTKTLYSNLTEAEYTESTSLTAFGSDGFTLGADGIVNANTGTYVSWNWKESATAGFDIVSYTGNSSVRTISHNCGAIPKMMIVKKRSDGDNWSVYHQGTGAGNFTILNTTAASAGSSTMWNNTTPTASVFSLGNKGEVNANGQTFIAYLFADIKGYSKFGSYTGNGNANGTFVYTGFKPAFVILKESTNTQSWMLYDNKRLGYNDGEKYFIVNTSAAETINSDYHLDFLSNGIKIRGDTNDINRSGGTYIYMAFAENPFVTSSGVPATAR